LVLIICAVDTTWVDTAPPAEILMGIVSGQLRRCSEDVDLSIAAVSFDVGAAVVVAAVVVVGAAVVLLLMLLLL